MHNQGMMAIKSTNDPQFNFIYLIGGHNKDKKPTHDFYRIKLPKDPFYK